jgi:hypothetical protein
MSDEVLVERGGAVRAGPGVRAEAGTPATQVRRGPEGREANLR